MQLKNNIQLKNNNQFVRGGRLDFFDFGPLPGTELSCALYGFESLFLAHGACQHAYLGPRRVSWGSLAPLWRYAGANAAILVKKW